MDDVILEPISSDHSKQQIFNNPCEYMKVSDFMRKFNISRSTVIRLINKREIKAGKVGDQWRIPYEEFIIYENRILNWENE